MTQAQALAYLSRLLARLPQVLAHVGENPGRKGSFRLLWDKPPTVAEARIAHEVLLECVNENNRTGRA
jgi:hypothetical protein